MRTIFYTLILFTLPVFPAQAHFGHLGELAGHGHWVAVGVLIGGALAAAWLAGLKDEDDEGEAPEELSGEEAEETA